MRDLTVKDLEGIEPEPGWGKTDILAVVAGRGLVVYEEEKKKEEKGSNLDQEAERNHDKPMKRSEVELKDHAGIAQQCRVTKKRTRHCQNEVKNKEKNTEKLPNLDQRRGKLWKGPFENLMSCEESEEEFMFMAIKKSERNKNFKKQRKISDHEGPNPPPGLPIEFKNKIKELSKGEFDRQEILVVQKSLSDTDVNHKQNRFSIPSSHIRNYFLNDDEEANLKLYIGKSKLKEIRVTIVEPLLGYREIYLKRWLTSNGSPLYALNHSWNSLVADNELKSGQCMQLWAVRVRGELWLALVSIKQGEEGSSSGSNRSIANSSTDCEAKVSS